MSGTGRMEVDDKSFSVSADDVVLIPDGSFHRVYNDTAEPYTLFASLTVRETTNEL